MLRGCSCGCVREPLVDRRCAPGGACTTAATRPSASPRAVVLHAAARLQTGRVAATGRPLVAPLPPGGRAVLPRRISAALMVDSLLLTARVTPLSASSRTLTRRHALPRTSPSPSPSRHCRIPKEKKAPSRLAPRAFHCPSHPPHPLFPAARGGDCSAPQRWTLPATARLVLCNFHHRCLVPAAVATRRRRCPIVAPAPAPLLRSAQRPCLAFRYGRAEGPA